MQSLHLDTSCLLSLLLNDDFVDIEKSESIYSPASAADDYSGLFLNPSIFLLNIQDLRK